MEPKRVSNSNIVEETEIQTTINKNLDKYNDFIFSAGAGAGKTYSLIESLKYVVKKYGEKLKYHNQKVICITYTNVAVNEIKERLGNSDLALVSTIHETLWSLIKSYQKELVAIHKEKVAEQLRDAEDLLLNNTDPEIVKKFKCYRDLSDSDKDEFRALVLTVKDIFYKHYDCNSKDFKNAFGAIFGNYSELLKNVTNFKKIVSSLYKRENLLDRAN